MYFVFSRADTEQIDAERIICRYLHFIDVQQNFLVAMEITWERGSPLGRICGREVRCVCEVELSFVSRDEGRGIKDK